MTDQATLFFEQCCGLCLHHYPSTTYRGIKSVKLCHHEASGYQGLEKMDFEGVLCRSFEPKEGAE